MVTQTFWCCHAVSKHFVNIGVDLSSRIVFSDDDPPMEFFMNPPIDISIYMRPFSLDKLEKIIVGMKNTSAGSDSLNLLVLKIAFPYVADILTSLINLCLKRGTFPDCLKIAKITPVFKGGNKNDLGNYQMKRIWKSNIFSLCSELDSKAGWTNILSILTYTFDPISYCCK